MDQDSLNSSAHVPVRAKTNLILKQNGISNSTGKKKTILKWGETDTENYQQKINQVRQKPEMQIETDVEQQAINITDILQEASKMSVVKKIVSLKGPKWKASPKTFYRLIRRNKHEFKDTKSTLIKDENNGEVINPEEKSQIFADYYDKLAVPSNEEHYDEEFLEESKYRLALMNNVIKHTIQESSITTFNGEEILKTIAKLNSR
ncbi:unnamed protein product [Mytilus coruscus]|uniref:Uncharacterized protein n=1 Tax=Mytilus coruscus TaxID=42192 RepID=A0A6J8F0N8_MYTCO|nr:unnamed protein product [Mytilus coruscus]